MISKISASNVYMQKSNMSKSPSFGFAKLTEKGRETADSFGYVKNNFLNEDLFKRQFFFSKSALSKELKQGSDFPKICQDYGCSKNGKSNAEFIRTQILPKKAEKTLKTVDEGVRASSLISLFKANYDNPELSSFETDALLDMIKNDIENTEYAQYAGLIKVGAERF